MRVRREVRSTCGASENHWKPEKRSDEQLERAAWSVECIGAEKERFADVGMEMESSIRETKESACEVTYDETALQEHPLIDIETLDCPKASKKESLLSTAIW